MLGEIQLSCELKWHQLTYAMLFIRNTYSWMHLNIVESVRLSLSLSFHISNTIVLWVRICVHMNKPNTKNDSQKDVCYAEVHTLLSIQVNKLNAELENVTLKNSLIRNMPSCQIHSDWINKQCNSRKFTLSKRTKGINSMFFSLFFSSA